jgi:hypothetical protein
VLPPVRLPGVAPTGFGALADFRKLLAVHPMPKPKAPHADEKVERPAASVQPPPRGALLGARPVHAATRGDGPLPVVFAIVLLACGLGAVAYTARVGRT